MSKTIKLINENLYNVYILPEAREKMEMYCELCEKEVGWMGFVEKLDGVGFLIKDFVLLKQEVHATTTEIDPTSLLELWSQTPVEEQSKIKIWGHSHVNMAPSPSGQDDDQMNYFKDGNDWFIRLITNKKGDMNITIYDYKNGFEIHDDRLITYNPHRAELRATIQEEINQKVTEKKVTPSYTPITSGTYYRSNCGKYRGETKKTKEQTVPMFEDVEVKYVSNFDEVLNDPNYWQNIIQEA